MEAKVQIFYLLCNRRILNPPPGSNHHTFILRDNLNGPTHNQANLRDKPNEKNEVYNVLHQDRSGKIVSCDL